MIEGKAKEDFRVWLGEPEAFQNLDNIPELVRHAYLIKWFDSVNIIITVKRLIVSLKCQGWYFIITDEKGVHLNNHVSTESRIENDSRQEVLSKAINKAVEIYNKRINYGNPQYKTKQQT